MCGNRHAVTCDGANSHDSIASQGYVELAFGNVRISYFYDNLTRVRAGMMWADQATHQDNESLLIIADAKRGKSGRAAVKQDNESSLQDGLATSDSAVPLIAHPLFRGI